MGVMLVVAVYLLGHQQGMKAAPETVACKVERDAIEDAQWAVQIEAYENSPDATCDKIFELVIDDSNAMELAEAEDRYPPQPCFI